MNLYCDKTADVMHEQILALLLTETAMQRVLWSGFLGDKAASW
jgi:hypothetical protein